MGREAESDPRATDVIARVFRFTEPDKNSPMEKAQK
jgi:hypothetical protein